MSTEKMCIHLSNLPAWRLRFDAFIILDEAYKIKLTLCQKCLYARYVSKHLSGYKIERYPEQMTEQTKRVLKIENDKVPF